MIFLIVSYPDFNSLSHTKKGFLISFPTLNNRRKWWSSPTITSLTTTRTVAQAAATTVTSLETTTSVNFAISKPWRFSDVNYWGMYLKV